MKISIDILHNSEPENICQADGPRRPANVDASKGLKTHLVAASFSFPQTFPMTQNASFPLGLDAPEITLIYFWNDKKTNNQLRLAMSQTINVTTPYISADHWQSSCYSGTSTGRAAGGKGGAAAVCSSVSVFILLPHALLYASAAAGACSVRCTVSTAGPSAALYFGIAACTFGLTCVMPYIYELYFAKHGITIQ